MKLIANLKNVDRKATLQAGISAQVLMENAGHHVAQAVMVNMTPQRPGVILCGPGNNGGDGFVCARLLMETGFKHLTVVYTSTQYRNEALFNMETLMQRPITLIDAQKQETLATRAIEQADFVVDALFGSGLSRRITGLEANLIGRLNQRRTPITASSHLSSKNKPWVLAVDLPSGIDGATGQCLGIAVEADETITLASAKPGLYLFPGKHHAGRIQIADIGIPSRLIEEEDSTLRLLNVATARACLPPRPADGHKFTFGHVLVLAGSAEMPGAAILCAEAAMSAGPGLVTLATPKATLVQCPLMPEIMRHPLPDVDFLTVAGADAFLDFLNKGKFAAVVLGPGLGRKPQTIEAIATVLDALNKPNFTLPVIVDADALYALSQQKRRLNSQFILTPHVGECSRLLSVDNATIHANLADAAQQAQQQYDCTVVLKAATSVIATPALQPSEAETEVLASLGMSSALQWISPFGNAGMATAGSGDSLAGIIAAMAAQRHAQGLSVAPAALIGVALHGLAGDAAAQKLTPYAMHACDITTHLPHAFENILTPQFNSPL